MDNLENSTTNFENIDLLPVDNSLNTDILSVDNNLPASFQDPILSEEDLMEASLILNDQNSALPQAALSSNLNLSTNITENGVFTVDSTGEFTIDFLFDAGGYESELGIFSLTGMESLEPGFR